MRQFLFMLKRVVERNGDWRAFRAFCGIRSLSPFRLTLFLPIALSLCLNAQDAGPSKQALEHVLGTVTAVDSNAHTVTIKEDKTGTSHTIQLATTKTLLKVAPGAKDLKSAVRITGDDLQAGDRVDVRGVKADDTSNTLAAKSVVLMSARDLQQVHQKQAAEWQNSTAGIVTSVDAAAGKLNATVKTAEGSKATTIETTAQTEFTRYSPENPAAPAASQLAQIQIGDHVRVIGDKSPDGATIAAHKVYSGAFRTISGTVVSIGADGKSVTIKDLATKKPVEVSLGEQAAVHRLPPMMAMMLARRFNPSYKPPDGAAHAGAAPPSGEAPRVGAAGAPRAGNGDISRLLERAPKIELSDLKQGDAVVVSGVATGAGDAGLLATNVIAGVEPILQSAPQRQGAQSLGGDWGLGEIAAPQ